MGFFAVPLLLESIHDSNRHRWIRALGDMMTLWNDTRLAAAQEGNVLPGCAGSFLGGLLLVPNLSQLFCATLDGRSAEQARRTIVDFSARCSFAAALVADGGVSEVVAWHGARVVVLHFVYPCETSYPLREPPGNCIQFSSFFSVAD